MRIFRFDPDVTIPVAAHGSSFRLSPLVGPGSTVSVSVLYLGAGGLVGRHEAACRQLFCAVSGNGWASGEDGGRRSLAEGYAALWDEGELHEAGCDAPMTVLVVEGDFAPLLTGVTKEIVVTDYDEAWPEWFDRVRARVWPAVEAIALRIDHVGSTSVPGLAAKPIIDMDIVVSSDEDVEPAIEGLARIGYRWRGDLGVAGRQAFEPPAGAEMPGPEMPGPEMPGAEMPGAGLPAHHLYLVVESNRAHLDHVLLRDLLRRDPDARARYAALKRRNVDEAAGDMDAYVAKKAALVAELLTRARAERGLDPVTYWVPEEPT